MSAMRSRLLFLCHRLPYPPEKGEKIRAWHMLDHLCKSWDVDLACLVDDPDDVKHLPLLRERCGAVEWRPAFGRGTAASRALLRVRPGLPLTLGWFHDSGLAHWTRQGLAMGRYQAAFVYSSAMAPYAMGNVPRGTQRLIDMVDVDSAKWLAYAAAARAPMRQIWAREARTLLAFERRAAAAFDHTIFVSREEAGYFASLAPEVATRVGWVENGVDLNRFDPERAYANPYRGSAAPIVFTGTMSYRPNIEAVGWFAANVLPRLRAAHQGSPPEFHIVGANPAPTVQSLAKLPGVHVTGPVPDIRPYLAHAAVAVAPLRIGRGIQNKVLEAMAMARPVVASPQAFEGVRAVAGRDLLVAEAASDAVQCITEVLLGMHPSLGVAARAAVATGHVWSSALHRLDPLLRQTALAAAAE